MGLWTSERSRPARSKGPRDTNQRGLPDKRRTGTDRNVVGDSNGMSKATGLQKPRLTKELICAYSHPPTPRETRVRTLEQVNKREQQRTKHSGRSYQCMENVLPCRLGVQLCVHLCKSALMVKRTYSTSHIHVGVGLICECEEL